MSRLTDSTTSPERQLEACRRVYTARGWTEVDVAEDLDVSATKYSPFRRPQLGKWLTERADEFDVLTTWRLDRLIRSSIDLSDLIKWAEKNDKGIVSATEGFDLKTPFGRAMAVIIGALAELEAETIRLRVSGAHEALRATDRWASGLPPFHLKTVPHPSGHGVGLALNEETAPIALQMVTDLINGDSYSHITKSLNDRGILTGQDRARVAKGRPPVYRPWQISQVIRILSSPTLLGIKCDRDGRPILDAEGRPIQMAPPLIDETTAELLRSAIAERTRSGKRRRHSPNPLLRIGVCGECGAPLAQQVSRNPVNGGERRYARCGRTPLNCNGTSTRLWLLLSLLEERFWHDVAHLPATRRVFVAGTDNRSELATVVATIDRLRGDRELGLYSGEEDEERFRNQMRALLARRDSLRAVEYRPSRWELQETGRTWGDEYQAADEPGRTAILRDAGMRLAVYSRTPEIGAQRPWWPPESASEVQWAEVPSGRHDRSLTEVAIWREIVVED